MGRSYTTGGQRKHGGGRMSVRDDRLPPFAWVALDALDKIRAEVPGAHAASVRNVYTALAEAASRELDPSQAQFKTTRAQLAHLAGVSVKTVDRACATLAEIGLLVVEARQDGAGRTLPSIYRLRRAGEGDTVSPPLVTGEDTVSPPITRAGNTAKKKEPPTGDDARARADDWPPEAERVIGHAALGGVFSVLESLARENGAKVISKRALGHAMLGAPGRDYLGEAHRLASWMAEKGRPRRDIVATYRNWLGNAPERYAAVASNGHGPAPRRPRDGRSTVADYLALLPAARAADEADAAALRGGAA